MRIVSVTCLLCAVIVDLAFGQSLELPATQMIAVRSKNPTTIQVEYHKFVLLRHNDNIIAIHTMPDPSFGWDGINYYWYLLSDNSDDFFKPSPNLSDASVNPHVTAGFGRTNELKSGSGWINVAGLRIEWSKSNIEKGWIYLNRQGESLEIYPKQFDRVQDFSGKLDAMLWKSVGQLKAEHKKNPYDLIELKPGELLIDGQLIPLHPVDE